VFGSPSSTFLLSPIPLPRRRPAEAIAERNTLRMDIQRVEAMGLEPTTPCLQSRISRIQDLGTSRETPGQGRNLVTARIRDCPSRALR
jgi:hypothetical protein